MNDTQKSAIHELLEIALTTPKETADVFFDWHPHCNSLGVRVYLGGWVKGQDADRDFNAYLNADGSNDKLLELPEKVRSYIDSSNIEERKAERKAERIAELQAQLHELAQQ